MQSLNIHKWRPIFVWPCLIVWCVKNRNYLWVGHCMTLSGHFFVNYINIFQKIELQTVMLMCLTCLNLNWIKSYEIKHNFLFFCNFVKKYTENSWLINGHFRTIYGHFLANYIKIYHKTEIQTVILRCLVCQFLNWIKSYDIILVKVILFSCLIMHHFMACLPKWVLTPPKEISSHIFKMVIFSKFFGDFIKEIIR